ncbi:MAG: hypothetical protein ACFFEE_11450 [Candidatus Thorarchaeota archaeon]
MPLNRPVLDSRGYKEILTASVMIISIALTVTYPDAIPLATYIIQPSASALRDSSILALRSIVNAVVWGLLVYISVRIAERLRHKNR